MPDPVEYDAINLSASSEVLAACVTLAQSIEVYPDPFVHRPASTNGDDVEAVISNWLLNDCGATENVNCIVKHYS